MSLPLVSILMPVRNGLPYILEAIDSVLGQDFKNWELLIIDDHSSDDTVIKIHACYGSEPKIRVQKNRGEGIIAALHTAFESSCGQFITRMDADDVMPQSKLTNLLSVLEPNCKLVATGMVKYFSESPVSEGYLRYEAWLNELILTGKFEEQVYRECVVASPNWMVHRSCFENDIHFDSLSYPEDYDLVFRWISAGYSIKGIHEVTHYWREHAKRTSRNSLVYQQESFFQLKIGYFLKLVHNKGQRLQLIGTGKKGKIVAQYLKEKWIDFSWFTFEKKSGYLDLNELQDATTILTYWPLQREKQYEIIRFLTQQNICAGRNLWIF